MSDINANQPLTLTDRLRIIFADVIDPLVTFLARIGVTPNALTISGVILHIPVAYFLTQGQWRLASLMGLISLADALDGSLARKLGTSESNFGAFLDSTADRISEIILFTGFAYFYIQTADLLPATLAILALGGSLMVSYTRARAEALGYDCKIGFFSRIERYLTLFIFGMLNLPVVLLTILAIGTWVTVAQRIHIVWIQAQSD